MSDPTKPAPSATPENPPAQGQPPAKPPAPNYSKEWTAFSDFAVNAGAGIIGDIERAAPAVMDRVGELFDFFAGMGEASSVAGETTVAADIALAVLPTAPLTRVAADTLAATLEACPKCARLDKAKPNCRICEGTGVILPDE